MVTEQKDPLLSEAPAAPTVWRKARRDRLVVSVIVGLLIAIAVQMVFGKRNSHDVGGLFKGDFPAFYGAGVIVARGEGRSLYNLDLQARVQDEFWPSDVGAYSAFAYPPFFAALHTPLAAFDPSTAKAIYSGVMLLFLALAVRCAAPFVPAYRGGKWRAFFLQLSCLPLLSGVFGGQNVSLSMLLCAIGISCLLKERDIAAGMAFGVWLFKPQFALPMILASCLCGRWRVLLGVALPGAVYYTIGAGVGGVLWPVEFLTAAQRFSLLDNEVNGFQMISILGAGKAIGRYLEAPALLSALASIVSALVCAAVCLRCLEVRRGTRQGRSGCETDGSFLNALLLTTVGALLVSPHTLYYDAGIAIPAVVNLFRLSTDRGINGLLVVTLLVGAATMVRYECIFQPLTIFLLGAFLSLLRHRRGEGSEIATL